MIFGEKQNSPPKPEEPILSLNIHVTSVCSETIFLACRTKRVITLSIYFSSLSASLMTKTFTNWASQVNCIWLVPDIRNRNDLILLVNNGHEVLVLFPWGGGDRVFSILQKMRSFLDPLPEWVQILQNIHWKIILTHWTIGQFLALNHSTDYDQHLHPQVMKELEDLQRFNLLG